jgi:DNA-binding response OmpR family regulator
MAVDASANEATKPPHDDDDESNVATRDTKCPCVLVVDDHPDTREAYAEELRASGFRTAVAENGVVALKVAHAIMPDAILLDYAMPMMDGLQAALCLKRDPRTTQIPIVMITAYRHLFRGRERADEVLDKPCDPRDVVARLRAVIDRAAK